jgi:hypothetical protein
VQRHDGSKANVPYSARVLPEVALSQEAVATLIDRWTNEPGFKDEFRSDPHGTIVSHGIALTPEEEEAVKRMDWTGSDEELSQRVSKFHPANC